jgi:MFS family permease
MVAEAVTACVGGAMVTAWGLYLHASPLLIGVLTSFSFLAQFIQFPAAWLTSLVGHRRLCILAVGVARQTILLLAALPFLPGPVGGKQILWVVVSALYALLSVAGNNAWVAWMSDLVPSAISGRYFGARTALCTLGGTVASLTAGVAFDALRARGQEGVGLSAISLFAAVCGLVCTLLMLKTHDPGSAAEPRRPDWAAALRPFRDPGARGLLNYQALWNVGVGLSAGYFSLHAVENLQMGFRWVALHGAAMSVVRVLVSPIWGRVIDRIGARPVLLACSYGMAAIPALWLVPRPGMLWPLVVDVFLSGLVWSGQSVAAFQLPLSVAPRRERSFYLAAYNSVGGLCFGAATVLGGWMLMGLPHHFNFLGQDWVGLHVVFAASAMVRFVAAGLCTRIVEPGAESVVEMAPTLARELARPFGR